MTSLFLRAVASLRSAAAALLGGPRDPNSRSHVSKCADSRILLCKFQIPSFRVSKIPRPLCRSAEGTQFPNSLFPRGQIPGYSSANSRFQDSECADSWNILPGKFQIPSFRVSEAPSWVRAQGTPKFQIPSFRVSEAPSTDVLSQRDTHIPDSEFPSFRGLLLQGPSPYPTLIQAQGTPKFQIPSFRVSGGPLGSDPEGAQMPDSEIPSFRAAPRAHLARRV